MLLRLDEVTALIHSGAPLHIAGTENLLRQLPVGNWIGGSTEYFMTAEGGKVSNDALFVTTFPELEYQIVTYNAANIQNVTTDAYDNGCTIVIIPFESETHKTYAHNAAGYEGMFIKNIVGWIAGLNLNVPGQTPITVNGRTGVVSSGDAVALHLRVPDTQNVNIGMINIFAQDEATPVLEFDEEGFSVRHCLVNGQKMVLAEYLEQNTIDTKLPLVGNYSGAGVNISFKSIQDGQVNFYAPVFRGIQYRIAKPVLDYADEFDRQLAPFVGVKPLFSCNCILNFLYGELEGKDIDTFFSPITFGEIAYQLVNQTLVYVTLQ